VFETGPFELKGEREIPLRKEAEKKAKKSSGC
jgi:hypothetical protein